MKTSAQKSSKALHRFAFLTAVAIWLLLIAGGLVTSTDSGLAVPDWPLSYGMLFPPMVGGIFYEHGHRMIAGLVGLMILVLAIWLRRSEPRGWVRGLGYTALGAVTLQVLLGGLTVLLLLPPEISIAHACLGQAIFCLVVSLAWCTGPGWEARARVLQGIGSTSVRAAAMVLPVLAMAQLILGAVIRHTGRAVPLHVVGAVCLVVVAAWLGALVVLRWRHAPFVKMHVVRFLLLLSGQVALGVVVLNQRGSVPLRTAHVAVGALILAQSVVLVWEVIRADSSNVPSSVSGMCAISAEAGRHTYVTAQRRVE